MIASILLLAGISATSIQNTDFWIQNLRNPSIDIRINALQKLEGIKLEESVRPIGALLADPDPEVRAQAARTLGRLPFATSLEILKTYLKSEQESFVKAEITRSVRGLTRVFEKQEERTKGAEPASTETESDDDLELSGD